LYDKAQIQHEKELRNIDQSHGITLLRETEREVPEQIELLERAKAAAIVGQFSEARRLREEARQVAESELEARKQRVDREFSESRSILATRQQNAIEAITKKWEDEVNDLNAEVRARKAETQQRFESGVEIIRERGRVRCNALLADEDIVGDALFSLNRKISEAVRDAETDRTSSPGKTSPNQNVRSPKIVGGSSVMARKIGVSTGSSGRSSRSSRSRLSLDAA
jgi:hypothetical protein